MRAVLRSPSGLLGAALVAALAGVALPSLVRTPADPLAISLTRRFAPPGRASRSAPTTTAATC